MAILIVQIAEGQLKMETIYTMLEMDFVKNVHQNIK